MQSIGTLAFCGELAVQKSRWVVIMAIWHSLLFMSAFFLFVLPLPG